MTTTPVTSPVHRVPERARRKAGVNVGRAERLLSAIGGGALAAFGLRRRSLPGIAIAAAGGMLLRRGLTGRCEVYRTLGVSTVPAEARPDAALLLPSLGVGAVRIERSITICHARDALFRFLRDPLSLPRFLEHVDRVEPVAGTGRTRVFARGPGGAEITTEIEIAAESEGEMIAWRTGDRADLRAVAAVYLAPAPGARGTELRVVLDHVPPGGEIGRAAAGLFGGVASEVVRGGLRRLKQLLEAGEIATAAVRPRPEGG